MQNLMDFSYNKQDLRVQLINNEPYFCLKDVCNILEIKDFRTERLDKDGVILNHIGVKTGLKKDGSPAIQNVSLTFINESNLYRVIFRSDKAEAKQFQDWVFNEVLPSIRKTGSYKKESFNEIPDDKMYQKSLEVMNWLMTKNQEILKENQELKPKAEKFDILLSAKNSMTMNEVAKTIGWGRNKLFEYLREKKILMENNLPYQNYCNSDYFKVREFTFEHSDGRIEARTQTLVTQKGIDFILKTINHTPYVNMIEGV